MRRFKIKDIACCFGLFIDDEVEAEDEIEAKDMIMCEICDNIGNYVDIALEECYDEDDEEELEDE